ncbi:MAG TPA: hypothetical protein VEA19_06470 [Actinomycetota bacterium]|nr:hypothetical protein [Actinomycetota bacterium]
MIELTPRAREILLRAHAAASRLQPEVAIRIRRSGDSVEFELAEGPEGEDIELQGEAFRLVADPGLEGVVAVVEPHDRLVLRPKGSAPLPGEVVEADGH